MSPQKPQTTSAGHQLALCLDLWNLFLVLAGVAMVLALHAYGW
jgi:hypothetical protein